MPDFLQNFWNFIYIDVFILIVLIGYGQNKFLKPLVLCKDSKTDSAWKTAALSIILVPLYLYFSKAEGTAVLVSKAIITFIFATSVYELAIRPLKMWLEKLSGGKPAEDVTP